MTPTGPMRPPLDRDRLTLPAGDDGVVADDGLAGWQVEVVDEITSTNAEVGARARAGADAGLVVVAEHQSAGRGRLDRTWDAPARSGLVFSVLLRPTAPAERWPWLPLATGYAVAGALRSAGFDAAVKWPNDVLLRLGAEEGKVAGILVERVDTARGPAAVLGIGLNVSLTTAELPTPQATSLLLARAGTAVPDRTRLLVDLLRVLRRELEVWDAGGPAAQRQCAAYAESCASVGRDVRVELPSGPALVGRAVGVDPGGRLVVQTGGGTTAVVAGDVVHARLKGRPTTL